MRLTRESRAEQALRAARRLVFCADTARADRAEKSIARCKAKLAPYHERRADGVAFRAGQSKLYTWA